MTINESLLPFVPRLLRRIPLRGGIAVDAGSIRCTLQSIQNVPGSPCSGPQTNPCHNELPACRPHIVKHLAHWSVAVLEPPPPPPMAVEVIHSGS